MQKSKKKKKAKTYPVNTNVLRRLTYFYGDLQNEVLYPIGQRCWRFYGDPHLWSLLWTIHLMGPLSAKLEG